MDLSEEEKRAVLAARVNFFDHPDRQRGVVVVVPQQAAEQEQEQGPAQDDTTVQERLKLIEAQLQTLTNLMQAYYDDRDSLRTLIQNMSAATQNYQPGAPIPAGAPVQPTSPGHAQHRPGTPLPGDPEFWEEGWRDDGAEPAVKEEDVEEDEEEKKKTCGVCHLVCRKTVKVLVPCGHLPYCPNCVDQMIGQKNDMPLFRRPDDYDNAKLYCPLCQQACTDAITFRPLHPYRDTVAEI